jgi:hypothetical protein
VDSLNQESLAFSDGSVNEYNGQTVKTQKGFDKVDSQKIIENFGSETPSFYDGFTVKY